MEDSALKSTKVAGPRALLRLQPRSLAQQRSLRRGSCLLVCHRWKGNIRGLYWQRMPASDVGHRVLLEAFVNQRVPGLTVTTLLQQPDMLPEKPKMLPQETLLSHHQWSNSLHRNELPDEPRRHGIDWLHPTRHPLALVKLVKP